MTSLTGFLEAIMASAMYAMPTCFPAIIAILIMAAILRAIIRYEKMAQKVEDLRREFVLLRFFRL